MEHWNEFRTAYAVARLGTVSAASESLRIHRATVIRHIDLLESVLGTTIFQRHAKGYTPTETGLDLLRVAKTTEEQLNQFAGRAKGRKLTVTGELIVTSVEIVAPLVIQALQSFRVDHPATTIRYIASGKLLNLSYGEAHIAIRAGSKPTHPDNVVLPLCNLHSTFYAHSDYVKCYGLPTSESDFVDHWFISHEDPKRTPFFTWLESRVSKHQIVLRSQSQRVLMEGVMGGLGIGFMPTFLANVNPDLHEVIPPQSNWCVPLWLVTHVDIHRTAKVQAISKQLRKTVFDLMDTNVG